MRKLLAGLLLVTLSTSCFGATIKFFTDYPNSVPAGSDFFVLQRNQGYVNSTAAQVKSDWFNNPVFTGNGGIQGVWTAVTFVGDGSQLTGIASSGNVTNTAVYFAGLNTNFTLLIGANGTNYVNQVSNALYQLIGTTGSFIQNFNGNGTNTTNWGVSTFQELDAANFYPTNMFVGLTNVILGTDSDGKLIATNITSGTTYSNLTESGFTMLIRSNLVTKGFILESNSSGSILLSNATMTLTGTAAQPGDIAGYDGATNLTLHFDGTNLLANYAGSGASLTNMAYIMKTNNGGGSALVAGAPGTALTCILTNITADTTLGAMTFWSGGMSVIPIYASCSGGANKQLKFPANFQGAGDLYGIDLNSTGDTITNGEAKWFEVRCIYGVKTNVFHSATK